MLWFRSGSQNSPTFMYDTFDFGYSSSKKMGSLQAQPQDEPRQSRCHPPRLGHGRETCHFFGALTNRTYIDREGVHSYPTIAKL